MAYSFFAPRSSMLQGIGQRPSVRSMVLAELSHWFPEQVILFSITCPIPAVELSMCGSSDETSTSIMTHRQPPLEVTVGYVPHVMVEDQQESYATEIVGDLEERIDDVSMQQVAKMAKSNAINCFSSQPELTVYGMLWRSKHGGASFTVQKRSFERAGASITHCWYMNQRKCAKR